MTAEEITVQFTTHQARCKKCASNGQAVCGEGLRILRLFQRWLNSDSEIDSGKKAA